MEPGPQAGKSKIGPSKLQFARNAQAGAAHRPPFNEIPVDTHQSFP